MKKILYTILLFSIGYTYTNAQGLCDTAYWHHTYSNDRLKVYDSCVTITATINLLDPPLLTGDGDYHIYTTPDSAYKWMVNYRTPKFLLTCLGSDSTLKFPGALNVEEVCKGTIEDIGSNGSIENAACNGFNDTVYLPNIGEHVLIRGPFIFDSVHCWNEIHPVSSCVVTSITTGISQINSDALANGLKVYPQPANTHVRFQFEHAPNTVTLIKLYTLEGRQLFVYGMSQTNILDIDVTDWPAGTYLYDIVLKDENKVIKSGKVSITH